MNADKSEWIIAHRGLWADVAEQNTRLALINALNQGFGVETDLREHFGKLVISHDPPVDCSSIFFEKIWSKRRFAYNIKSDGLGKYFQQIIHYMKDTNSFVFDGSIPEMLKYRQYGVPHALRLSEFEKDLPWPTEFIWIDGFREDWWLRDHEVLSHLEDKHLVFVSPELHGRDHKFAFDWFIQLRERGYANFSVCTDYPLELRGLCD
jgi:hypothetical protein